MRIFLAIIFAIIAVSLAGMTFVLYSYTLIDWWAPTGVCMLVAIAAGVVLKRVARYIVGTERASVNFLIAAVYSFVVCTGLFYTINYYCSDSASAEICEVAVTAKYTEEHYRTRRIGRNRVARGEKYLVYRIEIELPSGRHKTLDITAAKYARIRNGSHIPVTIETGFFRVPVIRNLKYN